MEYNGTLGEFIRLRRKELGLTQKELAQKIGVSDKAVSKWETLDANPDIALLLPLSEVLQVSVEELLKGSLSEHEEEAAKEESGTVSPTAQKPTNNRRRKDGVLCTVFAVLSVLLGLLTVACLISLALAFGLGGEDTLSLSLFYTALLIIFAVPFVIAVKKTVQCSNAFNAVPTTQKELDGYVIYQNLNKEEKREIRRRQNADLRVFFVLHVFFASACVVVYVLAFFIKHIAVPTCGVVVSAVFLVMSVLNPILRTKWLRKK